MNVKKLLVPLETIGFTLLSTSAAFAQNTGPTRGDVIRVPQDPLVKINSVGTLVGAILGFMLIIAAVAAFIFLILGGLQWITSGGDKGQLEAARNKITNAIVGLIVVAAAFAIMVLVQTFLGLDGLFGSGGVELPRAF